jgi:antitoxin (DNA-binding transcriptional repressor) of toxin-antitoxin stability system
MKLIDTRTLQHHLGNFLDQVEAGATLEVHRRHKPIARIVPWAESSEIPDWPDVYARLCGDFPDGPISTLGSDQLYEDRGGR